MFILKTVLGKTPQFGENVFLADNATIIGDVVMGDDCSVCVECTSMISSFDDWLNLSHRESS